MESINLCNLGCDRDCISNLPEDVLSEILSRLPTKDAIRTSILSKAWEYKWTSTYNVDIDDEVRKALQTRIESNIYVEVDGKPGFYDSFPDREIWAGKFANFMDRTIHSFKRVKRFSLKCAEFYDLEHAHAWISAALTHKLESFEVLCPVEGVVYPCSLLNMSSLRQLKVGYGTLNVATKNIVANLTSLDLWEVNIVNENPNTSTVAFTFPVLETLTVRWCSWSKPVEINAPLLATFSSSSQNDWEENPCSFALIAPGLAKFTALFYCPEKFILTGSSIVSATIECSHNAIDRKRLTRYKRLGIQLRNLLNQLTTVEQLCVEPFIIELSRLGPPLCCYDKLAELTIYGLVDPVILCHILDAAPSLKYVKLCDMDDDEWEVDSVPSCIVYELEEVVFFAAYPFEQVRYNMAKFLLKNGGALKKITLGGYGSDTLCPERLKVRDTLLGFPRLSANVIIE